MATSWTTAAVSMVLALLASALVARAGRDPPCTWESLSNLRGGNFGPFLPLIDPEEQHSLIWERVSTIGFPAVLVGGTGAKYIKTCTAVALALEAGLCVALYPPMGKSTMLKLHRPETEEEMDLEGKLVTCLLKKSWKVMLPSDVPLIVDQAYFQNMALAGRLQWVSPTILNSQLTMLNPIHGKFGLSQVELELLGDIGPALGLDGEFPHFNLNIWKYIQRAVYILGDSRSTAGQMFSAEIWNPIQTQEGIAKFANMFLDGIKQFRKKRIKQRVKFLFALDAEAKSEDEYVKSFEKGVKGFVLKMALKFYKAPPIQTYAEATEFTSLRSEGETPNQQIVELLQAMRKSADKITEEMQIDCHVSLSYMAKPSELSGTGIPEDPPGKILHVANAAAKAASWIMSGYLDTIISPSNPFELDLKTAKKLLKVAVQLSQSAMKGTKLDYPLMPSLFKDEIELSDELLLTDKHEDITSIHELEEEPPRKITKLDEHLLAGEKGKTQLSGSLSLSPGRHSLTCSGPGIAVPYIDSETEVPLLASFLGAQKIECKEQKIEIETSIVASELYRIYYCVLLHRINDVMPEMLEYYKMAVPGEWKDSCNAFVTFEKVTTTLVGETSSSEKPRTVKKKSKEKSNKRNFKPLLQQDILTDENNLYF